MGIHGVDEDDCMKTGNQMQLYEAIKESDRVICF